MRECGLIKRGNLDDDFLDNSSDNLLVNFVEENVSSSQSNDFYASQITRSNVVTDPLNNRLNHFQVLLGANVGAVFGLCFGYAACNMFDPTSSYLDEKSSSNIILLSTILFSAFGAAASNKTMQDSNKKFEKDVNMSDCFPTFAAICNALVIKFVFDSFCNVFNENKANDIAR